MKRVLSVILCMIIVLGFSACGVQTDNNSSSVGVNPNAPQKPTFTEVGENGSRTDDAVGFQLELPKINEKIVVFETTMGEIYIRVFPQSAPITVTNFIGLVESGYYNGITFHRVINDFMLQGGDPTATGRGGESIWGTDFEDEFNANLLNIRGSLSMANAGPATNGSQFFINQAKTSTTKNEATALFKSAYDQLYSGNKDALTDAYNKAVNELGKEVTDVYPNAESYVKEYITNYIGQQSIIADKVSDEAWELYKQNGGNIHLDGAWRYNSGHTVFGQVFLGMNVVDAIARVDVDDNDKPKTDVVINRAYTTTVTNDILALANR